MRFRLQRLLAALAAPFRGGPAVEPPDEDPTAFTVRYDRVFDSLSMADLQRDSSPLDESGVLDDLFRSAHGSHYFLNTYSEEGARHAFERYGFFDLLRKRGFEPVFSADVADPDEHRLRIHDGVRRPDRLLIEASVSVRSLDLPGAPACRMLFINWLLMQDPRRAFRPTDVPLPGQAHPGLGLFLRFGYLLRLMAARVECEGMLNHPSYFHNGVLYGKMFHFADPQVEGTFLALTRDLAHLPLAEASNALRDGRVVDAAGAVAEWQPVAQVLPISPRARA
ncbi:MAG: hypothetical protein KC620_17765 [Myxococcales bacterium]|nr:hypothetical protein [Myxococcales bacterium]